MTIRNASAADPAIGELWSTMQRERLGGARGFASHLVEVGGVRQGLGIDELQDVLWTCIAPEVFDLFVLQRRRSVTDYAEWLAMTLIAFVVGDD